MHATSHDGGTIRAASLVRVSTKGQADKGLSLDEQDRRVAHLVSVTESRARQGKHNGGPRPLGYD